MDDQLHSRDDARDDELLNAERYQDEDSLPNTPPGAFYRSLCIGLEGLRRQPVQSTPAAA